MRLIPSFQNLTEADTKTSIKYVLMIVWPILLENLLGSVFGMVDMMMIGQLDDPKMSAAAVASVGITNQAIYLGMDLTQAFNVGGTAIIARYIGAKRKDEVPSVVMHVLIFSTLFLTLPYSLLTTVFAREFMLFMGAKTDTLQAGLVYFRILSSSFIFQGIVFALSAALRGGGEMKVPMKINIFANALNVLGNACLIYGLFFFPKLGVIGAGLSTAISKFISCLALIIYMSRSKTSLRLAWREKFNVKLSLLKDLLRIGIPACGERLIMRLGIILYTRIVTGLGTSVYAAHQTALNICSLSFVPGNSFGITASTLVGQSLGEENPKKAQQYIRICRRLGLVISMILAIVFYFFAREICALYNNNVEVVANAVIALRLIALVQPFQCSTLINTGALRGAGDTVYPMVVTLVCVLILRVSLAHIFIDYMGMALAGAWVANMIDQLCRYGLVSLRVLSGKWKNVKIS